MHENRNLLLFLIDINNMHHTRHILRIPRTCIWGRCGVSWHRLQDTICSNIVGIFTVCIVLFCQLSINLATWVPQEVDHRRKTPQQYYC